MCAQVNEPVTANSRRISAKVHRANTTSLSSDENVHGVYPKKGDEFFSISLSLAHTTKTFFYNPLHPPGRLIVQHATLYTKYEWTKETFRPWSLYGICSLVADGDRRARSRDRGQDLVVLLNVDDVGTRWRDSGAGRVRRGGISEGDRAEVGKGNEGVTLLEVLDDPLSVLLAKSGRRGDLLADALAVGVVRDDGGARGRAGGGDGESDGITSLEGNAGEIV